MRIQSRGSAIGREGAASRERRLQIAKKTGADITPLRLQKLVYFAHGWHLGLRREPLSSEPAQAWDWGPVFPGLYHEVKRWGNGPIREPIKTLAINFATGDVGWKVPDLPEDSYPWALCNRIWDVYGQLSGVQLSALTHESGSPWEKVRKEADGADGQRIPDDEIATYFGERFQRNKERATA